MSTQMRQPVAPAAYVTPVEGEIRIQREALVAPAVLQAMIQVARPIILESYTPDCCIESTWISIEVLRRFGAEAVPLPVQVALFNGPAWRLHTLGFPIDGLAWKTQSAWSVGVGYGTTSAPDRWNGHLVAIVPTDDGDWLLDLSIGQVHRPGRNLDVGPMLLTAERSLLLGEEMQAVSRPDLTVVYGRKTDRIADDWRKTPAWMGRARHRRTVQEIERAIRLKLAEEGSRASE
jgi:hypothetical protein